MNRNGNNYDDMTLEELQREFREAFFETDMIDDNLNDELEKMQEALNRKRPVEYLFTPEESWEHYLEDKAEDLESFLDPMEDDEPLPEDDWFGPEKSWQRFMESRGAELAEFFSLDEVEPKKTQTKTARPHFIASLFRRGLIAAVIVVLLAGAVLAADSLGLMAWVPGWNPFTRRYEPVALEPADVNPIPATLTRLGITEPLYPAHLPEGFVITESHVNDDPLVLMEQYARGEKRFSITINPVEGFKTAVYQKSGEPVQEYYSGGAVHYIFAREGTITSLRYTDNYVTIVSGSIELEEIKNIIDSLSQVTS